MFTPIIFSEPRVRSAVCQLALMYASAVQAYLTLEPDSSRGPVLSARDRRVAGLIFAHWSGSPLYKFMAEFAALLLDNPLIASAALKGRGDDSDGGCRKALSALKITELTASDYAEYLPMVATSNPNAHSYPTGEVVLVTKEQHEGPQLNRAFFLWHGGLQRGNHLPTTLSARVATVGETLAFFEKVYRLPPHPRAPDRRDIDKLLADIELRRQKLQKACEALSLVVPDPPAMQEPAVKAPAAAVRGRRPTVRVVPKT